MTAAADLPERSPAQSTKEDQGSELAALRSIITKLSVDLRSAQQMIAELREINEELSRQLENQRRELNKNSSNSHKPPSSDDLGKRRNIRKQKKPTGRKRGAQPGHKGHRRAMVAPAEVDVVVDHFPERCEFCQEAPPRVVDEGNEPVAQQVVELADNGGRYVTEHRAHTVTCNCGALVPAPIEELPRFAFGPRLSSVICTYTEQNISRRQVVVLLREIFGIRISLGSVSNIEGRMTVALAAPSEEAMEHVEAAAVKNLDETSWLRDSKRCSVWVFASLLVSVFRVVADGSRQSLREVFSGGKGTLISDRASVFLCWAMARRQICWSHLLRLFIDFSQRDGPAAALGRDLVAGTELVFHYWREFCAKRISREELVRLVSAVRDDMKPRLEKAAQANIAHVSGSCANLLEHWDAMWTFMTKPGVEPTNNLAERELRRLVLWRKRSFGSHSERGDRYVERIMTVTHSLRRQKANTVDFLHQAFVAMLNGTPAPKLIPAS